MSWNCSNCGTKVDPPFQVCWNCGTDAHGNRDENFSPETDPDELSEHPEIPRIRCLKCGYDGKVLFSTREKSWVDWMVAGLISSLVSQRSWIHFCHKICPKCGSSSEEHVNGSSHPTQQANEIWLAANLLESQQTRKRKILFLLILVSLISASLILWFATR